MIKDTSDDKERKELGDFCRTLFDEGATIEVRKVDDIDVLMKINEIGEWVNGLTDGFTSVPTYLSKQELLLDYYGKLSDMVGDAKANYDAAKHKRESEYERIKGFEEAQGQVSSKAITIAKNKTNSLKSEEVELKTIYNKLSLIHGTTEKRMQAMMQRISYLKK